MNTTCGHPRPARTPLPSAQTRALRGMPQTLPVLATTGLKWQSDFTHPGTNKSDGSQALQEVLSPLFPSAVSTKIPPENELFPTGDSLDTQSLRLKYYLSVVPTKDPLRNGSDTRLKRQPFLLPPSPAQW